MSYAQPSPPTIQMLGLTNISESSTTFSSAATPAPSSRTSFIAALAIGCTIAWFCQSLCHAVSVSRSVADMGAESPASSTSPTCRRSVARRVTMPIAMPRPNCALSSNSEFAHAGPWPSSFVV
eukprot:363203-Chlamydomonas_euryale.AAC.14